MFVENLCTYVIKIVLVLCGNSTFLKNQSPAESENEGLHKLLKLVSVLQNFANETDECQWGYSQLSTSVSW